MYALYLKLVNLTRRIIMRAAFYECDITPPLGCFVWGHYKPCYCVEVHNRLYAKAVVVEDNGELAAIVVVDCCALPPEMHDAVTKRIFEYTGIPADKVCLASNHAHWGASISDSPEIGCSADAAYKDVAFRLTADAVILAYNRLKEADIKFGTSIAPGIAYSRNFETTEGKYVCQGRFRDNIKRALSKPDEELPALIFERDGKPFGAIIAFACHQCTVDEKITGYSGDYASYLSLKLKEKYGEDFVSLFLIGTCGDVNHLCPDRSVDILGYKEIGEKLAEYYENSKNAAKPLTKGGVASIKEYVTVPRRSADPKLLNPTIERFAKTASLARLRNMIYYVSRPEPESTDLAVQCIRIGDTLIACLPGEIYTDFGRKIKERSPFKNTMVVENCNTYCGYIPTKEVFDPEHDDLYETSLCYHSCHIPEAGDMLTEATLKLAEKLK